MYPTFSVIIALRFISSLLYVFYTIPFSVIFSSWWSPSLPILPTWSTYWTYRFYSFICFLLLCFLFSLSFLLFSSRFLSKNVCFFPASFPVSCANVALDLIVVLDEEIGAQNALFANEPGCSPFNSQVVDLSQYRCKKVWLSVVQIVDLTFSLHDV